MSRKSIISVLLCLALSSEADDKSELEAITALVNNIEALSEQEGAFSYDLFDPLMRLARLQLDFGQQKEAIDTLHRAQNIAHRSEGVYSPKQLPIINLLAELDMDDGEFEDANKKKRFAFFVSTHAYEPDSLEVLTAYTELNDWYMNTGQSRRASDLLKKAINLGESTGQNTLHFSVLDNQARRIDGKCCNPKRLITALKQRSADTTSETLLAAYLEIADSFILGGKAESAGYYFELANEITPLNAPAEPISFRRSLSEPLSGYSKSYQVTRNMPLSSYERLRRMTRQEQLVNLSVEPQWFLFDPKSNHKGFETRDLGEPHNGEKRTYATIGHPLRFSEDQLNQLLPLRWKKNKKKLSISISFSVIETGNLKDIEIMESNAPSRLNRLLTRALRKTYYRPAFKLGKPIASQDVTLVQTFVPRETTE